MPQVRKNSKLLRLLAVDEAQLPTAIVGGGSLDTPPPCSPAQLAPPSAALIFQPPGHPKQALIDGELWPPIFQAEAVRQVSNIFYWKCIFYGPFIGEMYFLLSQVVFRGSTLCSNCPFYPSWNRQTEGIWEVG